MDFQSEVIREFQSILRLKCKICAIKTQIYPEKETENNIPVNNQWRKSRGAGGWALGN